MERMKGSAGYSAVGRSWHYEAMSLRRFGALVVLALVAAACASATADTTVPVQVETTATVASASTTEPSATMEPIMDFVRIDDPTFDGGFLNAVVAAGPGLVAVGSDELPEDAAAWVSADGTTWERIASETFSGVPDENGLEGSQFMADVTAGPGGILAVGSYEHKQEDDIDAAVWLSPDGLVWERIDAAALGGAGSQFMYSVTTWNGAYVAVGETAGPVGSDERRPVVWISNDGRDWEAIEGTVFRFDATISAVIGRGSRLLAVGTSGHVGRPTVWFSDDGRAWDVVLSEDAADSVVGSIGIGDVERDSDVFMNAIVATPNGLAAAGGTGVPSRAIYWESPDGLFWSLRTIVSDYERGNVPVAAESIAATSEGLVAVGTGTLDTTRYPPLSFAEVWV